MIRSNELPVYLRCITEELSGPVRAEVGSDYARKVIDAIVLVLCRLQAQATEGNRPHADAAIWDVLAGEFAAILPGDAAPTDAPARGLGLVDARASEMQARLLDPQAFDGFVDALIRRDDAAGTWMGKTAGALHDLLQGFEDQLEPPGGKRRGAPTAGSNIQELRDRLSAYLRSHYPALPADPIVSLSIASGGQIKRIALFELVANEVLPTRLVLRQDMPFNFTGTSVTDEFHIIARAHGLGLPVPQPILVEADADILGGTFMIMTEVEGSPAGTYFPEERRYLGSTMGPGFGDDVAGALARLHSATLYADGSGAERAIAKRAVEIEEFKGKWRRLGKPALSLIADLGLAWLIANPLPPGRPYCMTHGDVGAHNMMTKNGRLAALLDWELSCDGDPAEDLAQAKMMLLEDVMPWPEFKASYVAQGGPPDACDDHAVAYFSIWTYLRHLALNVQLYDYFMAGERDDAPAASICGHFLDRLLLYEARAVTMAIALRP